MNGLERRRHAKIFFVGRLVNSSWGVRYAVFEVFCRFLLSKLQKLRTSGQSILLTSRNVKRSVLLVALHC